MSVLQTNNPSEATAQAMQMKSRLAQMARQQADQDTLEKNDLDRPVWKFLLFFVALFLAPLLAMMGDSVSGGLLLLGMILVFGLLALNKRVTALARLLDGREEEK